MTPTRLPITFHMVQGAGQNPSRTLNGVAVHKILNVIGRRVGVIVNGIAFVYTQKINTKNAK